MVRKQNVCVEIVCHLRSSESETSTRNCGKMCSWGEACNTHASWNRTQLVNDKTVSFYYMNLLKTRLHSESVSWFTSLQCIASGQRHNVWCFLSSVSVTTKHSRLSLRNSETTLTVIQCPEACGNRLGSQADHGNISVPFRCSSDSSGHQCACTEADSPCSRQRNQ